MQVGKFRLGMHIYFDGNKGFPLGTLGIVGMDALDNTGTIAHGPHGVALQGKNIKPATVEYYAQRINQKGHVMLVNKDSGMFA